VEPAAGSPHRAELERLLAAVPSVNQRPHPGGYERGCRAGQGCVFGPAWSDGTDAPDGHDGCDTRDDVLAKQLTEVAFRPVTHNCVVVSGVLADPYTGKRINFRKADAGAVQIDHVYPLAAAWDMGAAAWTPQRRARFANDTRFNLLAVSGPANLAKSDKTPGDWLPPERGYHCFYAGKYLNVAAEYQLPITSADRKALQDISRNCD
jgi:hypothetical protein